MNSFRNFLSFALALLVLTACAPRPALSLAQSSLARLENPEVAPDDLRSLVDGNNAFALDLYHTISGDSNLIFSPYSISLALAMTYAGARGDTATQMAQVLHFALPDQSLHTAFNHLDWNLTQSSPSQEEEQAFRLHIANALWAQKDHPFLPEYLDLLAMHYGAGVHLADFARSEATRHEINDWVSRQTEDRIKDLIPAGALDALTRLVLVNAIYFKADWETPFEAEATREAPFYLLDGSQITVPMMSADLHGIRYARGANYQVIELPYRGGTAVMDILLPEEGQFESFAAALNVEQWNLILGSLQVEDVQLHFPKFHFTSAFELSDVLASLGMKDAFDPDQADFSGMDGSRDLYIGRVLHKAFVAVDEKGTEAAAATAVVMRLTAAMPPSTVVTVDRPFLFLIRDLSSGQILFFGQVLNPLP